MLNDKLTTTENTIQIMKNQLIDLDKRYKNSNVIE